MSLDGIKVNHGALEVAVDDMRQMVARIDERMNQLESELEPLKSSWAGNAQTAYHVAKGKWDQAIYEMRDLLNDTHLQVTSSNDDYRAADRQGAALFGG
jgi:6 kDa early secretory antigenic target